MKLSKLLFVFFVFLALTACGGHDFEGEYTVQSSSSNELVAGLVGMAGIPTIVIGSDYVESDGEREEYDSIFVKKSGSSSYLVLESGGQEETLRIVDKNTLSKGSGFTGVKLVRID